MDTNKIAAAVGIAAVAVIIGKLLNSSSGQAQAAQPSQVTTSQANFAPNSVVMGPSQQPTKPAVSVLSDITPAAAVNRSIREIGQYGVVGQPSNEAATGGTLGASASSNINGVSGQATTTTTGAAGVSGAPCPF